MVTTYRYETDPPAYTDPDMVEQVSVTCPECRVTQLVEQQAMVAVCSNCEELIRCLECATCGHCFATLKQRHMQCPRCLTDIRTWQGSETPFATMAEQRGAVVAPVDLQTVVATTPVLLGEKRQRRRWGPWLVFTVAVVVVLGVAGVAIALNVSRKPLPVPCQTVAARTILTPTVTRTARGAYVVTATGTTVNQSPGALRDLVVLWAVTYADGATGRPTATSLATTGVIARGATLSWRATASSGDGAARPIGITVLHTVTTAAHPTCLT